MPRLVRQFASPAPGPLLIAAEVQADGTTVPTGCPAASAAPLDRIQAPGWPGRLSVASVKAKVCGESVLKRFSVVSLLTATVVWLAGSRFGRIHSGMAIWRAAKMARVTAMAGTVRRISAPAVTPRVKAKAA